MSTELIWQTTTAGSAETSKLGELLGNNLTAPAVIELASDLGGGKTTFTQGLAKGLGSSDIVSSPTFTISRIYKTADAQIHHFDLYRLSEPGIVADQLAESLSDPRVITVVEWSGIVAGVLPEQRLTINFEPTANDADERQIAIHYAEKFTSLIKKLETDWADTRP